MYERRLNMKRLGGGWLPVLNTLHIIPLNYDLEVGLVLSLLLFHHTNKCPSRRKPSYYFKSPSQHFGDCFLSLQYSRYCSHIMQNSCCQYFLTIYFLERCNRTPVNVGHQQSKLALLCSLTQHSIVYGCAALWLVTLIHVDAESGSPENTTSCAVFKCCSEQNIPIRHNQPQRCSHSVCMNIYFYDVLLS